MGLGGAEERDMLDKGSGPSASEAGLRDVSPGTPGMSKSERLHRWADSLELRKQLQLEAIDDAPPRTYGRFSMQAESSPLTIAFEDWAFRAEGLRGDALETALAFFDLSEEEMQRIIGCSDHSGQTIPATAAAERVRGLAKQAEARTVPDVGVVVVSGSIAAVLGLALANS
jgi:hypothetical protein